jgi:hypothetical protein
MITIPSASQEPCAGPGAPKDARGSGPAAAEKDLPPQAAAAVSRVTSANLPVDDLVSALPGAGPAQ